MEQLIPHQKVRHLVFLLFSLSLLLIVSGGLASFFNQQQQIDDSLLRLRASEIVTALEKNEGIIDTAYSYAFIGLSSQVEQTNTAEFPIGAEINLYKYTQGSAIIKQQTVYFLTPILKEKKYLGSCLILFAKRDVVQTSLSVQLMIGLVLVVGIMLLMTLAKLVYLLKNDVFQPINEIHFVTKEIQRHNFASPIRHDNDGLVGRLSHDFELLRDELKASEELANQLKHNEKELLASISHDLKTPLAVIQGYVEGIYKGIVTTPTGIANYCENILLKTDLLNKLIDDILEHSEIDLNHFSIKRVEVYTSTLFEPILAELANEAVEKKYQLKIAELPNVLVAVDGNRLQQVLQNIVDNSLKYSREELQIKIDFMVVNQLFVVKISDNGVGIAYSDLPFIFNPFYRSEKARSQLVPGSGLGLAIVKNIIEKHGGEVECESQQNIGTTIRFSLPLS